MCSARLGTLAAATGRTPSLRSARLAKPSSFTTSMGSTSAPASSFALVTSAAAFNSAAAEPLEGLPLFVRQGFAHRGEQHRTPCQPRWPTEDRAEQVGI